VRKGKGKVLLDSLCWILL